MSQARVLVPPRRVNSQVDKNRSDWKLSVRWAWFIGENKEPLKLTTKPEPYTLDRTFITGFKQRTEPCADGDCCYRYLLGIQA